VVKLIVSSWLWGDKYDRSYVDKLVGGIERNLSEPHRIAIFSPESWDLPLTKIPGCYCRLRMFDPAWQRDQGIDEGDRLVCLDLDTVIVGRLDEVFDRPEPFVILQGANASNPCPYNGSMIMLRAGAHPEVWRDFSVEAAAKVPYYDFPDDQGWLAAKVPGAAGWRAGEGGVYAFAKPGWPRGDALPSDARIVTFPGRRDPGQFVHLPWVAEHWR
jgi:hypothetical protein